MFWRGAAALGVVGSVAMLAPQAVARATEGAPTCAGADWRARSQPAPCRAVALVRTLGTTEAKLEAVRHGFHRFGIPEEAVADGPAGLRSTGRATALPSPIVAAASFDPAIASLYGDVIGRQFRAAGRTIVLGPALDVARTWHAGRIPESYGEDPHLASEMGVASVSAIQAHRVIATVKHFAAYAQEAGRLGDSPVGMRPAVNEVVAERTLREIYLPPFEAAVVRARAGGVMCAFPRINGTYACENSDLLGILKDEWGFDGAVMPDFPSAQRSVVAAVNAGLDEGKFFATAAFPGAPAVTPGNDVDLATAVHQGSVSVARLDDMLVRRLVPGFRLGLFDESPTGSEAADVRTAADGAAAARIAEAGAVLLKNDGGLLPIRGVRRLAIIGAQAGDAPVLTEGGSARVEPHPSGPAWRAVAAREGATVATVYEPGGLPLGEQPAAPASAFRTADGRPGLTATYVANRRREFAGPTLVERVEGNVRLDAAPDIAGIPADNGWSVRWSGTFVPPSSGRQRLTLSGSGSASLFVDGRMVARFDRADFGTTAYATLDLAPDRPVPIRIEWTPREAAPMPRMSMFGTSIGTSLHLGWASEEPLLRRAVAAASKADAAVVFVAKETGEGADQTTLSLPADQDGLVEAVARANPHTVVVVTSGGPVTMPWLTRVRSVLQTWYAGDSFPETVAALLSGDAHPGGRLPITFPANERQGPGAVPSAYPGLPAADGSLADVRFEEGLAVGYRYYQAHGQTPLFPFGYGLTYAGLDYSRPTARLGSNGTVEISVPVRNHGRTDDEAVVQTYVGFPADAGEPGRRLAGFAKATVRSGSSVVMTVRVPATALRTWDGKTHAWRTGAGAYTLWTGTSSRDGLGTSAVRVSPRGGMSLR